MQILLNKKCTNRVTNLPFYLIPSMEVASPKGSSVHSSPYSSPNVGALLKIKVISWSQKTGLPVTARVRVTGRTFNLHKLPLFTKSGYFKRELDESNEVELPDNFPGGADTFELIALFIYGSSTLVDPFNVAALRCAAEFLEMTEEFSTANLCERFDMYLNQVVLQSWDDTLIVLQKCQRLLPWAEELLIVSRCIESIAFMACMEILDPERRREKPIVTLEALANKPWSCEAVKDVLRQDLWIKDLIALPFVFFKRIIGSLRRQGMKEKYVSPLVLFYANKWILSTKTNLYRGSDKNHEDECKSQVSHILEEIVEMLPEGRNASKAIPVGFHFSLLSKALEFSLKDESREKLQDQIVCQLHLAEVDDFLLPMTRIDGFSFSVEVDIMKSLFSTYVSSSMKQGHTPSVDCHTVAELWDMYLTRIASDPELSSKRFTDLIETMPTSSRQIHDNLYRALNNFLMVHPHISEEVKAFICKYLNCQKLSQEVCIEAVQNELMPLRLIIQALSVQQLNTQQTLRECSDSFRYTHCIELSGSLSSSRCANNKSQHLRESPYIEGSEGRRPLSALLKKEVEMENYELKNVMSRQDFESTSFRIQSLEKEILSLKRALEVKNNSKKRATSTCEKKIEPCGLKGRRTYSRKRNHNPHVAAGIGNVNFSSQRNFASKLLNIIRKLSFLGRGKANSVANGTSAREL